LLLHAAAQHAKYPLCTWSAPLQVLGNAKGVVAVVFSLLYFRNPVNFYSVFGYSITVTGVVMYSQVTMLLDTVVIVADMGHFAGNNAPMDHSTTTHGCSAWC
jgi:hypothetical protein